jgi:hypothetical protein
VAHPPPADLRDLVGDIAPRPLLLIAAPNSGHGEELNRGYLAAAREPKALWEIPESRHVGGRDARPRELSGASSASMTRRCCAEAHGCDPAGPSPAHVPGL